MFVEIVRMNTPDDLSEDYDNLVPGSIHKVLPAPVGASNVSKGVWVMGDYGLLVKVLAGEYRPTQAGGE